MYTLCVVWNICFSKGCKFKYMGYYDWQTNPKTVYASASVALCFVAIMISVITDYSDTYIYTLCVVWIVCLSKICKLKYKGKINRQYTTTNENKSNTMCILQPSISMKHHIRLNWDLPLYEFSKTMKKTIESPYTIHFIIHYRQKIWNIWKHNGSSRIWHFDLLKMAWHRPKRSIVSLMEFSRIVLSA